MQTHNDSLTFSELIDHFVSFEKEKIVSHWRQWYQENIQNFKNEVSYFKSIQTTFYGTRSGRYLGFNNIRPGV